MRQMMLCSAPNLLAAEQIQRTFADGVPRSPVVANAAHDNDTKFRRALLDMGLEYVVGVHPT
jgi:SRSO17 transposase